MSNRLATLGLAVLTGAVMIAMLPISQIPAGWGAIRAQESPSGKNSVADDPSALRPRENTNCVRCHSTAGRELTAPVFQFARSAHDRAQMSCHDCHGGNIEDDIAAHEPEFEFIGTKLSAHMTACADCHTEEADSFRKSAHYWDLTQRINRDYPVCVDCHGNHDVGKPPPEFALMNVCTECHKEFKEKFPHVAAVVEGNDELWEVLRKVQEARPNVSDPTPAMLRRELAAVRYATARLIHPAKNLTKPQADAINHRVRRLRQQLEDSLRSGAPKSRE